MEVTRAGALGSPFHFRLLPLALAFSCLAPTPAACAATVPPVPRVAPVVHPLTDMDRDGDRLDDLLNADVLTAFLTESDPLAGPEQRAWAGALVEEPALVEFNFTRQVTQRELDAFTALGGEITHVYRAVGYGWNGWLPLSRLDEAVAAMGPGFNGVVANRPISATMYDATRNSSTRSVWPRGYTGDPSTTIAVMDSGLDDSHPDLAGRIVYWKDYAEGGETPSDPYGHGTAVASVAAGSGAVGGISPATLKFTQSALTPASSSFPPGPGPIDARPVRIPTPVGGTGTPGILWDASVVWSHFIGEREVEGFVGLIQPDDSPDTAVNDVTWFRMSDPVTDTTGAFSFSGRATGYPVPYQNTTSGGYKIDSALYMAAFRNTENNHASSNMDANAIVSTVSARNGGAFTLGDGYPLLSGVAPGSRLAGFKVLDGDGRGGSALLSAALDDLASLAPEKNIQIANMSLRYGKDLSTLRDKTNAAVNAGVFITAAAGNDGPDGEVGDPGEGGKAMTVGASTADNRLAFYSSGGRTGSADAGRDAIKPDILAPGGSLTGGQVLAADSNDGDYPYGSDQRANDYTPQLGTSLAAPHVAGAAALVINAWQKAGHVWSFDSGRDPLFIKMVLAATATETAKPRERDVINPDEAPRNSPPYGGPNAPKDAQEGYGVINVDAAVESVSRRLLDSPTASTLIPGPFGKRAAGFRVFLRRNVTSTFQLAPENSGTGSFLVCLYRGTPDANGNPVLLAFRQSSRPGETLSLPYTPSAADDGILVVKELPNLATGAFTLSVSPSAGTPPMPTTRPATGVNTTSAMLTGLMNPRGTPTAGFFEYGPTAAYGSVTQTQLMGAGTANVLVQEKINGVPVGATIHYRLVALVDGTYRAEGADQYLTTWAPVVGDALRFDGVDDAVRIPGFGNVAPGGGITVEFWQKAERPAAQSTFKLLPDDPANRLNAHVPWADGKVYWDCGDIGGSGRLVYTPPEDDPIRWGQWEHWAFAAGASPPRMAIYRNGELVAGKLSSGAFAPRAADLWLGTEGTGHFSGEMDEFRVWNTYRSGAEIEAAMWNPLTGAEPGLVAYYRMDDASGTTLRDALPDGIPGTLTGLPVWVPSGVPVGGPYALADVLSALRIAGGLAAPASPEAAYRADLTRNGAVDLPDAVLLIRKVAGLSANP